MIWITIIICIAVCAIVENICSAYEAKQKYKYLKEISKEQEYDWTKEVIDE